MAATRETYAPPQTELPFKINSWSDLEYFEETERWHDRQAFLDIARQRLDNGIRCITLVQNRQLAFVDWIRPDSDRATFGYVGQTVAFPSYSSTQFSAYVHPAHRGRGLFHEGMRRVLDHLFKETDTLFAMAAVEGTNRIAFNGHLKVGFDTVATLATRRLLGHTTFIGESRLPSFALQPQEGIPGTWLLETVS